MTNNNNMYFIANWKMYGDLKSLNSLNKVIKFTNTNNKIIEVRSLGILTKTRREQFQNL